MSPNQQYNITIIQLLILHYLAQVCMAWGVDYTALSLEKIYFQWK